MNDSTEMEARSLPAHVLACAERYRGINDRLRRLELAVYLLLAVLVANGDGPLTDAVLRRSDEPACGRDRAHH